MPTFNDALEFTIKFYLYVSTFQKHQNLQRILADYLLVEVMLSAIMELAAVHQDILGIHI